MRDDVHHVPIEHELDLHTFHPRDVVAVVEEFVWEASRRGITDVRVVHGRGKGVQRALVQAALEKHPAVIEFWDDTRAHLGATIARLSATREA